MAITKLLLLRSSCEKSCHISICTRESMACLGGSLPSFTAMVVLHHGRASYICTLLVIPFLIKLACVVLRNPLSNVTRDSRKCQASAHFLHSSARYCTENPRVWSGRAPNLHSQLSIWVLIGSQRDLYAKCAVLGVLSPPCLRFAKASIFIEWLWKNANFRLFLGIFPLPLNKYWCNRKPEIRRRKHT